MQSGNVGWNENPEAQPLDLNIDHDFAFWQYCASNRTLTTSRGYGYEIDLETINSSAEMLDWIFQIHNKGWGKAVTADLILAFQELFDPQANLCSFGQDHRLPPGFLRGGKKED